MYFPDYKPTEQELAIQAMYDKLTYDRMEKDGRVRQIQASMVLLRTLEEEAAVEAAQADVRLQNFMKDNNISGMVYEAAVSE